MQVHPYALSSRVMFHTVDICEQIAEKLRTPLIVSEKNGKSFLNQWSELSLACGWPGLALFYAILNKHFPNGKYDQIAHSYLKKSISELPTTGYFPLSIFQGLSGICLAAHFCSQDGKKYSQLTTELDRLLIDNLDDFFQLMDTNPAPNTYSLGQGLSGVLTYLTFKQNSPMLWQYATKCVTKLVQLMNRKITVLEHSVPGWYEPYESVFQPEDQEKFPNGKFSISMLYGVSGILAALSIAALEGIRVDGLHETISLITEWLKGKKRESSHGPSWPKAISFEEEIGEAEPDPSLVHDGWVDGVTSVARSLFLASRALNQSSLQFFAEDVFLQFFSKRETSLKNLSFISGKAGLLATTYRMSQDTKNPVFFKKVGELEDDLKSCFDPLHPLGFQTDDNDPGIAAGAAGIALSLLMVQGGEDSKWDRIFLLG